MRRSARACAQVVKRELEHIPLARRTSEVQLERQPELSARHVEGLVADVLALLALPRAPKKGGRLPSALQRFARTATVSVCRRDARRAAHTGFAAPVHETLSSTGELIAEMREPPIFSAASAWLRCVEPPSLLESSVHAAKRGVDPPGSAFVLHMRTTQRVTPLYRGMALVKLSRGLHGAVHSELQLALDGDGRILAMDWRYRESPFYFGLGIRIASRIARLHSRGEQPSGGRRRSAGGGAKVLAILGAASAGGMMYAVSP